jgi:dipeptidyl aminopeptidase/acylaminoacyl peptidase
VLRKTAGQYQLRDRNHSRMNLSWTPLLMRIKRLNIRTIRDSFLDARPVVTAILFGILISPCQSSASAEDSKSPSAPKSVKRAVTMADSIGMTLLADERYYAGYSPSAPTAVFSPDGKQFVVVLRRGELERNTNSCKIVLWQTAAALRGSLPQALATMESSSNRQAIEQVKWLDDNETLAFLGETAGGNRQLYLLNVHTLSMRRLTNSDDGVVAYDITGDGKAIAYTTPLAKESIFNARTDREGILITTQHFVNLINASNGGGVYLQHRQLYFQSADLPARKISLADDVGFDVAPHLSPDGKHFVIAANPADLPSAWKAYFEDDSDLHSLVNTPVSAGDYSWLSRYWLVDTDSGSARILLDAPISRRKFSNVAWLPDSRSVALQGVFLPLNNVADEERLARQRTVFSVEAQVLGERIDKITQEDLTLVEWNSKLERLLFKVASANADVQSFAVSRPPASEYFRKDRAGWKKTIRRGGDIKPEIVLDEGINLPPKLYAMVPGSNRKSLLLDLNPQLAQLDMAKVEEVHWLDGDGRTVMGGLYIPPHHVAGKRDALVIQTHGWNKNRFWMDGASTSGYAAQAMAARGLIVLQVDEKPHSPQTFSDVQRMASIVENAIDYLDQRSLIDRTRVGIVAFSYTGTYVKYALTHSKYHFSAAAVSDDNDVGYFQYIMDSNSGGSRETIYRTINGGYPFGEGLKSWMLRAPAFSADRNETPTRILVHAPGSVPWEWEWFVAMRLLKKPVEMVYMQDGEHVLQRPWERVISQQGNVNWFDFWLNGHEEDDPEKAGEYARWEMLCDKQAAEYPDVPISCARTKTR